MSRTKRTFTPEDRLSLLQEAEREGYLATCRKYNLSPSLLAKWKQRYLCKGVAGLNPSYRRIDPAVRALEEENERLKRIIARQALELEVKGELLKKHLSNQGESDDRPALLRSSRRYGSFAVARIATEYVILYASPGKTW